MWTVTLRILRAIPPALMLGGGTAALVYGFAYHTAPVSEEQEVEVSTGPPSPFAPPGQPPFESPFGQPPFPGGPPMIGPPPFMDKVTVKVIVTEDESEPTLIREVSIGGVTLLAAGELMRTYSGEPPLLCPT